MPAAVDPAPADSVSPDLAVPDAPAPDAAAPAGTEAPASDAPTETVAADGHDAVVPAKEDEVTAVSRLEEEGDIAADYLEELLDIADIDGDIDIEVRNGRTYISIVTEEEADALQALVGQNGEVLDALQELTRLSVLSATETRSRLVLDISGYRGRRNIELTQLAQDAADAIKAGSESVALAPMGAYERKIVHDAIAELGLESESEGEGVERHIVVSAT